MQDRLASRTLPHERDGLASGNALTLCHAKLAIVPVRTQIRIVVFNDNKLSIAYKSTSAVDDVTACGRHDRLSDAPGNVDPVAAAGAAASSPAAGQRQADGGGEFVRVGVF